MEKESFVPKLTLVSLSYQLYGSIIISYNQGTTRATCNSYQESEHMATAEGTVPSGEDVRPSKAGRDSLLCHGNKVFCHAQSHGHFSAGKGSRPEESLIQGHGSRPNVDPSPRLRAEFQPQKKMSRRPACGMMMLLDGRVLFTSRWPCMRGTLHLLQPALQDPLSLGSH